MNAIKQVNPMLALLVIATIATTCPAAAQTSLPRSVSAPQSLSMGSAPQSYGVLHVNVTTGSDQQGTGSAEQPYKTITHALRRAPATSTVILLAPGHYSQDSGEQFPLRLRPGITIQGNSGETRNTLIVGGGEVQVGDVIQNVSIVTADRSGLANILVSNANGSGVWISTGSPIMRRVALVSNAVAGVKVTDGSPVIENSYFHGNQRGLTIEGNGHALIRGNYFEETGRAITVTSPATPAINNNRIARNQVGIALKDNARPLLNANALVSNGRNGVVEVTTAIAPISIDPLNGENLDAPASSHRGISDDIPEEEMSVSAIASVRTHQVRERPAILSAPAPIAVDEPADPGESRRASLSDADELIDEAVSHTAHESVDDASVDDFQVTADGGIPIAVIPVSEPEIAQSANDTRRDGVSKLLARLNRNHDSGVSPSENTVAVTTSDVPTPDIYTSGGLATNQRLPVPSVTIPSGSGSINLTPPGTVAVTKTFRYRVLVDMADAEDLESLVPDAFRTQVGSRMFMQAGAYVDELEAQERLEWLQENGIDGQVDLRH